MVGEYKGPDNPRQMLNMRATIAVLIIILEVFPNWKNEDLAYCLMSAHMWKKKNLQFMVLLPIAIIMSIDVTQ